SCSPGRGARVVQEIDSDRLGFSAISRRLSEVFPAPEGLEITRRRPRRGRSSAAIGDLSAQRRRAGRRALGGFGPLTLDLPPSLHVLLVLGHAGGEAVPARA